MTEQQQQRQWVKNTKRERELACLLYPLSFDRLPSAFAACVAGC